MRYGQFRADTARESRARRIIGDIDDPYIRGEKRKKKARIGNAAIFREFSGVANQRRELRQMRSKPPPLLRRSDIAACQNSRAGFVK